VIFPSIPGAAVGSSLSSVGAPGSEDVGVGVDGGPTVSRAVGAADSGPSISSGLDWRSSRGHNEQIYPLIYRCNNYAAFPLTYQEGPRGVLS
jgi:hypothetical protein